MSRGKGYLSNKEVARRWVYRGSNYARNRKNTFYFDCENIYSYGIHYPVATFMRGIGGRDDVIIMNTESWSPTTSMHRNSVRMAIRYHNSWSIDGDLVIGYKVFHANLCKLGAYPLDNRIMDILEEYHAAIDKSALLLRRSRIYRDVRLNQMESLIKEAKRFATIFQVEFHPIPRSITKEQLELLRMSVVLEVGLQPSRRYSELSSI